MKALFDNVCQEMSELTTKRYSTSFSLGISFLHKELQQAIYSIYGFVRFADEIVDTFHGYDKAKLLQDFKTQTYEAIAAGISLNPILHSFQWAVNKYQIPMELIDTFLDSMEMDLQQQTFDQGKYETYILGSAEVVGLMCLKVFVEGDQKTYEELKIIFLDVLVINLKQTPAEKVLNERIRIPNYRKMRILLTSYVRHNLNLL